MKKTLHLFFLLSMTLSAQERFIEGKIYADSIQDYQVNIININKKIGAVSSPQGTYKIRATINDSILFTSLQHKTYTLVIKEKHLKNKTSIFLEPQINELPEVTLNQYQLTGDLTKDIKNVKVDFVDQRQFGFGVPRELDKIDRELYSASTGMLTPLLYAITGQTKRLKKRKENSIVRANKNKILRRVDSNLITKDLNIPEIYIEDFAYFCAEDEYTISIMEKEDPLALIDELKAKALAYLELKNIQK
ncbi:hypothetical protein [Psychroflexus tropicus]|uniref:hypothetical protein n=1 Tax=Psychroflexus tropicus TaxID=197345 RepID=UPI0003A0EB82|nr:hypothetical protein [Psychroflexus tropicus]